MPFEKGKSGNPDGRPKGTQTGMSRKAIAEAAPDIIATLITQAKNGDTQAAKALLDKVLPNLRPQALPVVVETNIEGLANKGNAVIDATMRGELPPDIGNQLLTTLTSQAKLVETDDLIKRIEALEQSSGNK